MICPKCLGKGMVDYPMYADDEHKWQYCVARMKKCDMCNGTGEVEMTNEEWLRSASANDMARCIATKLLELARHEYGIYDVVDYATIFEWLKEKHDEM